MAANRSSLRSPIIPQALQTVTLMRAHGVKVLACCQRPECRHTWTLDLGLVELKRGPYYCLWGRRLRCRRCGDGEVKMLASAAPGGPRVSINAAGTESYPEVRRLRALCPHCGWAHSGYEGHGTPPRTGR